MKDMMHYKDYYGSVHYSDEDRVFFGRVKFIRALISYEGTNVDSLRRAFEEAVEDYLETCREEGMTPDKPFKGSFNIRVGPAIHQRLALTAARKGVSLNKFIVDMLEREASKEDAG